MANQQPLGGAKGLGTGRGIASAGTVNWLQFMKFVKGTKLFKMKNAEILRNQKQLCR